MVPKTRLSRLLWTALMCALTGACAPRAGARPPELGDGPWNLTVFHVNDMHGAFRPAPAAWRDDRAPVGGVIALASHLAEQRRTAPASLLLDAGDFMTGDPVCELADGGLRGGAWLDLLARLGFDAGVLGNHEFDHGRGAAGRLAARVGFPLMALDLRDAAGGPAFPGGPVVLERGGLRVGVIGLSCRDLPDYVSAARLDGLRPEDQAVVARRQAAALDPGTDLLVLITHDGTDADSVLARELDGSGVDLIVGGHSHTRLETPRVVGGILVVQAGSRLSHLGRLDLRVADDRIVAYRERLIPLLAEGRRAAPELEAAVAAVAARVDSAYGRVIGELTDPWRRDDRAESAVGDWICDALRAAADADVALLNSASLAVDLGPGPLTPHDVFRLLPYGNGLETFAVDGAALRRLARANAQAAVDGDRDLLQVSGLTYAYAVTGGEARLLEAAVDGQPISPARVYKVACPDYMALRADLYLEMARPRTRVAAESLAGVVVDAVERAGTVGAAPGGRIVRR